MQHTMASALAKLNSKVSAGQRQKEADQLVPSACQSVTKGERKLLLRMCLTFPPPHFLFIRLAIRFLLSETTAAKKETCDGRLILFHRQKLMKFLLKVVLVLPDGS